MSITGVCQATDTHGRRNRPPLLVEPGVPVLIDERRRGEEAAVGAIEHVEVRVAVGVQQELVARAAPHAIDEHHANGWREVIRELAQVDIANMTPVQALVLLNELQGRVRALSADSESG